MPPTFRSKDGLLARVNFPLYSLQMLTGRHVLVAGGGGSSKTGVANGFEIFEISHDGSHFVAEEVIRHETGEHAVMNCAAYSDSRHTYLVGGEENKAVLYNVKVSIKDSNESNERKENGDHHSGNNINRRKRASESEDSKSNSKSTNSRRLTFDIKQHHKKQTDFAKDEPLQKVVRISPNGQFMATGGTDGHVRLWKFPNLDKLVDIQAHSKEVDDVDFNKKATQVVSLSKDGRAVIWNVKDGKKLHELTWQTPEGSKYMYKRCRFGAVEEDKEKSRLFVLTNPIGRPGKLHAYLQQWEPQDGTLKRVASFNESVASLAVRDDGRFVAVGTMFSGSVDILIAFSLQRVLHVSGAHSMFVTGLEFLPVNSGSHSVTSTAEAAVISISVDNRVCIHTLYHRRSIPTWIAIILIVLTLFFTFVLCSFIGL